VRLANAATTNFRNGFPQDHQEAERIETSRSAAGQWMRAQYVETRLRRPIEFLPRFNTVRVCRAEACGHRRQRIGTQAASERMHHAELGALRIAIGRGIAAANDH
jgi:hypothetical protein